jgi:hypothetical protein
MQVSFASGGPGGRIPAALLAAQCRQASAAPPEGEGVSVAVGQVGVAWAQVGGRGRLQRGDTIAAMLQKLLQNGLRFTLAAFAAVLLPAVPALATPAGTTVAIGGALQDGTAAIWQRLASLVRAAPAGRDCWHVITIASAEPDEVAATPFGGALARGAAARGASGTTEAVREVCFCRLTLDGPVAGSEAGVFACDAASLRASSTADPEVGVAEVFAEVFTEALELRDAGSEGFIEVAEGPTKDGRRRRIAERHCVARVIGGSVRRFARHRRVVGDRQEVRSRAKDATRRSLIPTGTRLA